MSDMPSSSGLEDSGENIQIEEDFGMIQPYVFQPVEETDSESDVTRL